MGEGFITAVLVALVAVIFGSVIHHFRESLKDEASRKHLSELLFHPSYFGLLKGHLDWLEHIFGPTMGIRPLRFGGKGFTGCLFFALYYTCASFTIGWMTGAPEILSESPMFRETGFLTESWSRSVRGIIFLLILAASFLFVIEARRKVSERVDTYIKILLTKKLFPRDLKTLNDNNDANHGAGAIALVFAFMGTTAFTIFVVGGGFIITFVTIATVGAGAFGITGLATRRGIIFIISMIGLTFFFSSISVYSLVMWSLFFVLLPSLNALWDWGSLSLSRWLGRKILEKKSLSVALTLVIVDFIAAVVFLSSLAFVLPFFAGVLERLIPLSLDLEGYLEIAAANPWTEGFWMTFMLFSTLFPTVAHAAVALFSGLPCAGRKSWRQKLKKWTESPKEVDHLWPALYFSFWWVTSILLVGLGGWGMSWLLITGDIPVAAKLLEIARWSLDLSRTQYF